MDERKRQIMRAVIEDYIATAEPVGSRTIARKYSLGISPATIRNEMADLEESGYLRQPHTSAGRIPSDKGYRFYVDSLMQEVRLNNEEIRRIRAEYYQRQHEMERVIHKTAQLLTRLTNYAAVVLSPSIARCRFDRIKFVLVDEHHVLAILVTAPGFVDNILITLTGEITQAELDRLSAYFNQTLHGHLLNSLKQSEINALCRAINNQIVAEIADEFLERSFDLAAKERVYLEGALTILAQPEFQELEKARLILELLEEREGLLQVFHNLPEQVNVVIGQENSLTALSDCSLITATYRIGQTVVGAIGVIGPTRMKYAQTVSTVEFMAEHLGNLLTRMYSLK